MGMDQRHVHLVGTDATVHTDMPERPLPRDPPTEAVVSPHHQRIVSDTIGQARVGGAQTEPALLQQLPAGIQHHLFREHLPYIALEGPAALRINIAEGQPGFTTQGHHQGFGEPWMILQSHA